MGSVLLEVRSSQVSHKNVLITYVSPLGLFLCQIAQNQLAMNLLNFFTPDQVISQKSVF